VCIGGTTYSEDIEDIQALLLDEVSIRAATDNFDEVNKLGEGGFGQVYKVGQPNYFPSKLLILEVLPLFPTKL
jgi:hypothetical protein